MDDIAKAKWKTIEPKLRKHGVLHPMDGDVLAAYCQACAELQIATEMLQREGRIFNNRPHPAVKLQRDAMAAVERFGSLLGLNPLARTKLPNATPEPFDEIEALLRPELDEFLNDSSRSC